MKNNSESIIKKFYGIGAWYKCLAHRIERAYERRRIQQRNSSVADQFIRKLVNQKTSFSEDQFISRPVYQRTSSSEDHYQFIRRNIHQLTMLIRKPVHQRIRRSVSADQFIICTNYFTFISRWHYKCLVGETHFAWIFTIAGWTVVLVQDIPIFTIYFANWAAFWQEKETEFKVSLTLYKS